MHHTWPVLLAAAAVLVGGCGERSDPGEAREPEAPRASAAAVWSVAPGQQLGAETVELAVLVSRLGCNGGVTGEPQEPDVRLDDAEVVVTFVVTPVEPAAADCQGNDEVVYDVVLPEPLGERTLVDGQCGPEGEAGGTSFCRPDGVRYPTGR